MIAVVQLHETNGVKFVSCDAVHILTNAELFSYDIVDWSLKNIVPQVQSPSVQGPILPWGWQQQV